jgi:hypothetical protein
MSVDEICTSSGSVAVPYERRQDLAHRLDVADAKDAAENRASSNSDTPAAIPERGVGVAERVGRAVLEARRTATRCRRSGT